MEIYLKNNGSLDDIAQQVRSALLLSNENQTSYQKEQKRYGLNMGGDYYLFETPEANLSLVENEGEMAVEEREEWKYYLLIESDDEKLSGLKFQKALTAFGLNAELDDLAV